MCCGVCLQSELCGVLPHFPGGAVDLRYALQWGDRSCRGTGVHIRPTNIFQRLCQVHQEKVIYLTNTIFNQISKCVICFKYAVTEMTLKYSLSDFVQCENFDWVLSGSAGCVVFTWRWLSLPFCLYWDWLEYCMEYYTSTLTSTSEDFTST